MTAITLSSIVGMRLEERRDNGGTLGTCSKAIERGNYCASMCSDRNGLCRYTLWALLIKECCVLFSMRENNGRQRAGGRQTPPRGGR